MRPTDDMLMRPTRRHFLGASALGLGGIALQSVLGDEVGSPLALDRHAAPAGAGILGAPHFPAKVRKIIYLFQAGGPSQFETFAPKPLLTDRHGNPLPNSVR